MDKEQRKSLLRIILSFTLLILFIAAEKLYTYVSLNEIPQYIVAAAMLIPYLIAGYEVIIDSVKNIFHGEILNEDFLMFIASIGAFVVGEYAEAAAVMVFFLIGEFFEEYAEEKTRSSISELMDIRPDYANLVTGSETKRVNPQEVVEGSIILIKPGERIPIDSIVTEGQSFVDTSAITGESVPVSVYEGERLVSGCINGGGTLKARTVLTYSNSTVSRILELTENAASRKSRAENFITRFSRVYTPAVTGAAVLLAVIPSLISGNPFEWIRRACSFLVISCPCALVISVPLSFFGGIGAASRKGILIKGSNYLEALSNVRTVCFDKTGTLTKGVFEVTEIIPEDISSSGLLEYAAYAEAYSNHPAARAVLKAYGKKPDESRISDAGEIAGRGTKMLFDGRELICGNAALMKVSGIGFKACEKAGTVLYIAYSGRYLGAVVISDSLKENASECIAELKKNGAEKCIMLTGDREAAAKAAAAELGIDGYYAELLPADKLSTAEGLMAEAERHGSLAFVGDGINDAPVLIRADIGIAMGAIGSDASIEAADVVIMDDNLMMLPLAMRISRKTLRIVKQNIAFILAVKAVILVLGALGLTSVWAAVFADVGVMILAVFNAMRALRT